MLSDAVAFWKAIEPKIESKVNEMMANAVRQERYEVVTPPDGKLIEVKQPFGKPIKLPYASTVADSNTGDTVIVEWRGTLSTARVTSFGDGGNNALTIAASGTSGIWKYTKYNSGLAVCRGVIKWENTTIANQGYWGNWATSDGKRTPYPFNIYEQTEYIGPVYGIRSAIPVLWYPETATETAEYALLYPETITQSASYTAPILTIGRWK